MSPSHILVVEDEAIVSMEIEERLAAMGYSVAGTVSSGEQALNLASGLRPDLVLMDIRLREAMNGIDAAETLRRRFHIPVIFLSACSEDETRERAKGVQPFGYVLKPFDDCELKSTIEIALFKHRAEEEIRRLNRLYDVLSQVNQAIVRASSRQELLDTVCCLLVECGGMDLVWIAWLDQANSKIIPLAWSGDWTENLREADFYAGDRLGSQRNPWEAILAGKWFMCNGCGSGDCLYSWAEVPARFDFQSCASFPLRCQGEVCGALNLCGSETGFFHDREVQLLEEVATNISFALDKMENDIRRERSEAALAVERAHLRTLINTIPDLVWLKDPQGVYLAGNPAFERFMGVKEAELLGKTDYDFFPSELAEFFRGHDRNAALAGKPTVNEEWVTFADDGSRVLLETIKTPMQDDRREFVGVLGISRDITAMRQAEEALRKSEQRYRSLFDNMLNGFAYCRMHYDRGWPVDFTYLVVNSAFEVLTGFKDVAGKKVSEVIPGLHESDPNLLEIYGRVASTGKPERFEMYVKAMEMWFSISVYSPQKEDFVAVFDVITERKQAEEELRASEERYRALIEASSQVLYRMNPDWSEMRQLQGGSFFADTEKPNLNWLNEYTHPDDQKRVLEAVGEAVRTGTVFELEHRVKRSDGTHWWASSRAVPVRNASGEIVEWFGAASDITGRKRLEHRLRKVTLIQAALHEPGTLQEKLKRITDGVVDIFTADFARIWLVRPGDLCGSGCMHAEAAQGIHQCRHRRCCLHLMASSGRYTHLDGKGHGRVPFGCYKIGLIASGEEPSFLTNDVVNDHRIHNPEWAKALGLVSFAGYQLCPAHGETIGVLALFSKHPISPEEDALLKTFSNLVVPMIQTLRAEEEQARVEAQLRQAQKMEALGTLAGGIAHDFNNILGIIVGYSEMGQMDAGDGRQVREDLRQVLKAAGRARDLVQQILAFSRMGEQEKKPIQIGFIVKEAAKMLRAFLPSTVEIKVNVATKAVVSADPTQMHQVLMNLCTNSAHAMGNEGGVLRIDLTDFHSGDEPGGVHRDLQPGPYVKLTVEDSGHGIDPFILNRIFDPFFTTKEKGVGTGLGLSVVHGIVKSHGGVIEVESAPNEGATFQVFLPAMEAAVEQKSLETTSLPRGQERILLVDDEPRLASVTKRMLERLGYEVEYRTNGIEALEAFRYSKRKHFDLVITDMTMPHLTGNELVKELLKSEPTLPIIMCTGFSEKITSGMAQELGIRGIAVKPLSLKVISELIREVLDGKAS